MSSSSSSDSDDDGERKRLNEIVSGMTDFDTNSIKEAENSKPAKDDRTAGGMKSNAFNTEKGIKRKLNQPSLRPSVNSEESFSNDLQVTEGQKSFVRKKLSQLLDSMIEEDTETHDKSVDDCKDTGIKLFGKSKVNIKNVMDEDNVIMKKQKPVKIKRRKLSESSESDEDAKLAEAAIMYDSIMQESKIDKDSQSFHSVSEKTDSLSKVKACENLCEENQTLYCHTKKHKKKKKQKNKYVE